MKLRVRVKTNASKEGVERIDDDYYRVSVSASPEKGRANRRVEELLAKYFNVPVSLVGIIAGQAAKEKIIEIVE
ncbi:MAG: hypothetical protein COU09_00175 [Candidatus Harrisonbacteria bacterium CG10_big_fil_rev_8_21_14_0_10_44_23]|uniref:Uncharacterized protein n=1 Tax=Candidatus Harrisonbacteria bacterium CG10_big_fil_rev_8_21_14_0_10_44_23 TaxID=1974585 RepID=A0A2H0UR05_9BACT|nr:MAG: hypothetical protein COU09_00175 [Candidatus Harrisonbacteria bacterium CG10_big_fil_rev_8_21_14_0_10_44_23]